MKTNHTKDEQGDCPYGTHFDERCTCKGKPIYEQSEVRGIIEKKAFALSPEEAAAYRQGVEDGKLEERKQNANYLRTVANNIEYPESFFEVTPPISSKETTGN